MMTQTMIASSVPLRITSQPLKKLGPPIRDDFSEVIVKLRDQPLPEDKIADKAIQHLQPKNFLFATQQIKVVRTPKS